MEELKDFRQLPDEVEIQRKVKDFVEKSLTSDKKVVLVTCGGTSVPLEKNTVRSIENFSTGRRGATSAEYFLESGYSVIYLHRKDCAMPFVRTLAELGGSINIFNLFQVPQDGKLGISDSVPQKVVDAIQSYHKLVSADNLLSMSFVKLSEYLHSLRIISNCLQCLEKRAMIYLAAAVSDFHIPESKMAQHKIQSGEKHLDLRLETVPKMVGHLVDNWAPKAFVVTFKLETDSEMLDVKATQALKNYGHQAVVANLLQTRYSEVTLFTPSDRICIKLSPQDLKTGKEIEKDIVENLVSFHSQYM